MRTYLVGYDLNTPGKNYEPLWKALREGFSNWWHHLDSTWIIKTNLTAAQIATVLGAHIDANDELLVVRLQGEWASHHFNDEGTKWLYDNVTSE